MDCHPNVLLSASSCKIKINLIKTILVMTTHALVNLPLAVTLLVVFKHPLSTTHTFCNNT